MNIFTPNSKSLPQQVDANTKSIENLTKMCPRIYHARTEIDISSTTTLLSYSDVDTNAMDNAILIAQNGTIFKINGKGVDDSGNVILYIEFICTMLENKGDKGDKGETGATGLPALECSRVYNSPTQPLLNEIITIPLTALNRTPVSGDSLIVLYNYYEDTENNTIGSYLVNATFSSLTSQEASFEIINVVSNMGNNGLSSLQITSIISQTSNPTLDNPDINLNISYFNRTPILNETIYFYIVNSSNNEIFLCLGKITNTINDVYTITLLTIHQLNQQPTFIEKTYTSVGDFSYDLFTNFSNKSKNVSFRIKPNSSTTISMRYVNFISNDNDNTYEVTGFTFTRNITTEQTYPCYAVLQKPFQTSGLEAYNIYMELNNFILIIHISSRKISYLGAIGQISNNNLTSLILKNYNNSDLDNITNLFTNSTFYILKD